MERHVNCSTERYKFPEGNTVDEYLKQRIKFKLECVMMKSAYGGRSTFYILAFTPCSNTYAHSAKTTSTSSIQMEMLT